MMGAKSPVASGVRPLVQAQLAKPGVDENIVMFK